MSVLSILQNKVNLTKAGANWHGQCPKCGGSERTDKFVLYPDDSGHCFFLRV